MTKHFFPFSMTFKGFGLKGDAYALAEAKYNLEGEALDRQLATIDLRANPTALKRRLLDLDLIHNKIDAHMHDHKVAELEINNADLLARRKLEIELQYERITPYEAARQRAIFTTQLGAERDLALLDADRQHNRLNKQEYEKRRATLRDEPWVAIINSGFDPEQGIDGVFFEFDWNPKWIEFLKLNGYVGHSDEQIVDNWFTEVCRSHSPAELGTILVHDDE